jgi:hypothetical protein
LIKYSLISVLAFGVLVIALTFVAAELGGVLQVGLCVKMLLNYFLDVMHLTVNLTET